MKETAAVEVNFDGLVGPTHHFAGLATGNLASQEHRHTTSNPRAAARQGLAKMRLLRSLGIPQGIIPPQQRPNLSLLRRLGFAGTDAEVLHQASVSAPRQLAAAMSGSSMWVANAATVCPSADAADGRVHFTAANLVSSLHRASETPLTAAILAKIFDDPKHFTHHAPLPASSDFGDEGAANHTRLCREFGETGVQLFVYGASPGTNESKRPHRFSARQMKPASEAIARLHGLIRTRTVFAQQQPQAIDAGVFHNDVIAVGHRTLLFCHQNAFVESERVYADLRRATDGAAQIAEVPNNRLSLDDAVRTYLFNSQIVSSANDETILIAPDQCRRHPAVSDLINELIDTGHFHDARFADLGQSMNNGGGPACLRLRVVLTQEQLRAVSPGVLLDDKLDSTIENWIDRHYRDSLTGEDLSDPKLMDESYAALDELTDILGLGSIYDFQRENPG